MNHRLLFLAYYFPPVVGIASERAAAMSRHLSRYGWDPVVITPRNAFYHRAAGADRPKVTVIRTRGFEISRLLRSLYSPRRAGAQDGREVRSVVTTRRGARAQRLVRDFLYVPDAQVGWIPFAVAAVTRALADTPGPAILYSTSGPVSAHVAAMASAVKSGCPWVAEFRDAVSAGRSVDAPAYSLRRRIDALLERQIVARADHVVVLSESLRRVFLETYPDLLPDGVSVITNGFEPVTERAVPPPEAPMTLMYAGTVAPGEDVQAFLIALDEVHRAHPGRFVLKVLGPGAPWQPSGPEARPWLELGGMVTPSQAREAMAASSVLLFQRDPGYSFALPGKLFEYIGTRRPILAVCPPDSEMADLLRRHADARVVWPRRHDALVAAVEELLSEHAQGTIQAPRVPMSRTAELRRDVQAKRLSFVLDRVIARGGPPR